MKAVVVGADFFIIDLMNEITFYAVRVVGAHFFDTYEDMNDVGLGTSHQVNTALQVIHI